MDILAYVEALLNTHNEVGLNGFGTFVKTKQPGKFDTDTQSYIPPAVNITFKRAVTNGGLLAEHIAAAENSSLETATSAIHQFSDLLNNTVQEEGIVSLGNLGNITKEDNQLVFTPNTDRSFFGYPPVKERAQQEKTAITEPPVFTPANEIETVIPDSAEIASQQTDLPEEEDEEITGRPGYIKWLIVLFVLLAIAAVALMLKPELYKNIFSNSAPDTTLVDNNFDKETLKNNTDTLSNDSALNKQLQAALGDSLKYAADSSLYEIIVTAERNETRIQKLVANYNKLGFQAKIIPGKILKKISVATFYNEQDARDSLKKVQKKLKSYEAYIYHHKK